MTRALALALGLAACGGSDVVPRAPEPLRPATRGPVATASSNRSDCDLIEGRGGLPAIGYEARSVEEAENLAQQGFQMLRSSEPGAATTGPVDALLAKAVDRFVTALLADPYNVHATYNLAAAYARVGRPQCAVNLLWRLVPLHRLASQRDKVDEKLDRLFGRGSYKGKLDPDFLPLRDDPRFRELAREF
jgi:hypothetical protein